MFAENEHLLQAQTILNKCENFNVDQFFEKEILTRSKSFFHLMRIPHFQARRKFFTANQAPLLPSIATPNSQTINLLNNFAQILFKQILHRKVLRIIQSFFSLNLDLQLSKIDH